MARAQWTVFSTTEGEVAVIPPASSHPEMEVGVVIHGVKAWLRRDDAKALGEELIKQSKGGR